MPQSLIIDDLLRASLVSHWSFLSFKMDDCTLEKLVVKPGKLTPSFNKVHLEYDVTVPSDVEKIHIDPLTSDSGASYCIFVSRGSFVYIFRAKWKHRMNLIIKKRKFCQQCCVYFVRKFHWIRLDIPFQYKGQQWCNNFSLAIQYSITVR